MLPTTTLSSDISVIILVIRDFNVKTPPPLPCFFSMVWAMILLYRSECDRLPFPFSFALVKTEHGAWCLLVGAVLLLCSHLQPVYPILPRAGTTGVHQFG